MLTRIRRDERGFVLVVVVLSLTFLLLLVTSVMDYSIGSQNLSKRDQNWNASLAAAEAGIDDYIFHLNQDGSYWRFGNSITSPASCASTGVADPGNLAFTTWVDVPGQVNGASFRYTLTCRPAQTGNGTVVVQSTGRVGNVTRTVEASLRRRNFLDYLYFTDYETKDPAIYVSPSPDDYTAAQAQTYCAMYYYGGRDIAGRTDFAGDTDGNTCTEISFNSFDVINGPLHSNDAIRISGNPDFNGNTTTSWDNPSGANWWGSGSPTFQFAGDPAYADPLTMPPSNVEIKNETLPAFGGTGCLFTGPTAIRLNADATMDVVSPFSRQINCSVSPNPSTSLFNRFTITRMSLPPNGVIYVQNVPTTVTDPNYTAACPFVREAIGGTGASNPDRTHPLGFPQRYDISGTSAGTLAAGYGCRNGDVFLQGTLDGRLTIAADNNIIVFDHTSYELASEDLLGLVANNYIEVYHPVRTDDETDTTNCDGGVAGQSTSDDGCALKRPSVSASSATASMFNGTTPGTSTISTTTHASSTAFRNPIIQAAILTVAHSFRAQHYQYGDNDVVGTINVTGAITQKYRGIVTLIGVTGYGKNYVYDQRLKYDSPPKFLNPIASAWQVVIWAEKKAAFPP
jgi:hypothetical protein